MRKGGLVRVYDSVLVEELNYKALLVSEETTVEDVIRSSSSSSSFSSNSPTPTTGEGERTETRCSWCRPSPSPGDNN